MCNRAVDRKYVFNRRNITLKDLSADADDTGMQRPEDVWIQNGFMQRSLALPSLSLSLSLYFFLNEMMWTPKYAPGLLSLQKHSISVNGIKQSIYRPKKFYRAPGFEIPGSTTSLYDMSGYSNTNPYGIGTLIC